MAWGLDLSKNHLSQIESGKRAPSLAVLVKLAVRLGVEPGDLLAVDEGSPRTRLADAIRRKDRKALRDALEQLGFRVKLV